MEQEAHIRAIVARFSFNFSRHALEKALKQYPFEFCAHVTSADNLRPFDSLVPENQELFHSGEVRSAYYAGVDFNEIPPLDEEFILQMSECESVFMAILMRLEWKKSIPYKMRRMWYLRHLQFWDHYIRIHKINFFLSAWVPHEIPDIIIYYLCKYYKIPVVYFNTTEIRDISFVEHNIRESAKQIETRYQEILQQKNPERPLHEPLIAYEKALLHPEGKKPDVEEFPLGTYWTHLTSLVWKRPARFLKYGMQYLTPKGWKRAVMAVQRWYSMRRTDAFYAKNAIEPNFDQPFVYMALHFQPEATTVPMGGVFADQILAARLLNATLPDTVLIYVKEHPYRSSWLSRSIPYYKEFLELKKVRFIPKNTNTFALREHCKAVATVTGSVGFEALFREKPVFLFGSRFYQFAQGVYPVRSKEECKEAVHQIFEENRVPTPKSTHLYLQAMEDTCVHAVLDPWSLEVSHMPPEQHSQTMGDAIIVELEKLFTAP